MSVHRILNSPKRAEFWKIAGMLSLVYLIVRLPGLMSLPIFGDEAIYLRWAQLIRGEGIVPQSGPGGAAGHHWWVSLADPKPPLHFWLMALFFQISKDPLVIARLISVFAGLVCVPLMMAAGREFAFFLAPGKRKFPAHLTGVIAAVLAIFCPFLAFYQRLATADALFVAESVLIVWLSFRWARSVGEKANRWGSWLNALWLGLGVGSALLTRQGLSYTICIMPPLALVMHFYAVPRMRVDPTIAAPLERLRHPWIKGMTQLSLVGVISFLLWLPYLTAELNADALENFPMRNAPAATQASKDQKWSEIKRRIFYQERFTETKSHTELFKRNAAVTFIPGIDHDGHPDSGWFPVYMTPLVCLLCVAGILYTCFRYERVGLILVVWFLALLLPILLLAQTVYSRYALAAVAPLLFGGEILLGDITYLEMGIARSAMRRLALGSTYFLLLAWPVKELATAAFSWKNQTLTDTYVSTNGGVRGDRYQYLTGWTAGGPTRDAIVYLQKKARENPKQDFVVITDSTWGTPADALWVYLSPEPNVKLYWTEGLLQRSGAGGTFTLRGNKWLFPPRMPVRIAPGTATYYVINDPFQEVPVLEAIRRSSANFGAPLTFKGVGDENVQVLPVFP